MANYSFTTPTGANISLALNNDAKFSGTGSKITAEEWYKLVDDRVKVNKYQNDTAIDFACSLLEGAAAMSMRELVGCDRTKKLAIKTEYAAFMAHFKSMYFTHTTQAEVLTDWTSMRQTTTESIYEFSNRIGNVFRMFFETTNGTPPPESPEQEKEVSSARFDFETEREEEMVKLLAIARRVTHRLPRANTEATGLASLFIRSHNLARDIPKILEPGENITEDMIKESRKAHYAATEALYEFILRTKAPTPAEDQVEREINDANDAWHEALLLTKAFTYEQIMTNMTRALTLKTIHTGARHAKTREEAFTALKDPTRSMDVALQSMKQTEFELDAKATAAPSRSLPNNHTLRNRVNALEEWSEAPDNHSHNEPNWNTLPADTWQDAIRSMAESVNALTTAQRKKNDSKELGSKQNSARDQRRCFHCNIPGHLIKDCKKRIKEEKSKN